jgi:hypothetical protein
VQVVLPGEADAAVHLNRGVGDAPAGVGGIGLRHRGRQGQRLRLGVGGPGGAVDGRARVLGLEQHLRAAVGNRLIGPDRPAELPAILGVLDRHLHGPLGDPGRLGGDCSAGAPEHRQVVLLEAGERRLGRDADAVEAHGVEAASEVDRLLGRDRDPLGGALDQVAAPVGGGDDEEVGARRVHHQHLLTIQDDTVAVRLGLHAELADRRAGARLEEGDRATRLAARQRPQPALALGVVADRRQDQAGDRGGEQRRGSERVAHLLEEHCEVDDAEPLSSPLLRQRQAGPAELGHLLPVGLLEAMLALGQLADPLRFVAGGEELARGRLDRLLLVGEVEVHGEEPFLAHPRQAEHALGDDVLEDVGGAALDRVGARAQEAVLPGAVGDGVLGAAVERRIGALDL